ncbi:hypothetical protein TSUD_287330 [Trifolium subterraneum]|uniref:Uncharacterized protein n=1 Tax=Trifolium subterraneum TaxID=3900 RepID=A0A2Z6PBC2_TRISU|nr:hypothetical protein TSUD_287330 [Trifolium subterraneum]
MEKATTNKKAADVSPELKGSSIFLLGMKSSLKTNLGKLLADVLRYYYFDSDSLVEEALGGASVANSLKENLPLDTVARDVTENQSQVPSLDISTSGSSPEVMDELVTVYNKYKDGYATADAVISLQKVATRLGYENLDDITIEDMALEVLGEIEKLTRVKKMMAEAARPF